MKSLTDVYLKIFEDIHGSYPNRIAPQEISTDLEEYIRKAILDAVHHGQAASLENPVLKKIWQQYQTFVEETISKGNGLEVQSFDDILAKFEEKSEDVHKMLHFREFVFMLDELGDDIFSKLKHQNRNVFSAAQNKISMNYDPFKKYPDFKTHILSGTVQRVPQGSQTYRTISEILEYFETEIYEKAEYPQI